ncbi:MAG: hypothetical protein IPK82_25580 [Polyangiaceae bacterium]|nr:hypothetical protein [Polyangiaceae bacterium]
MKLKWFSRGMIGAVAISSSLAVAACAKSESPDNEPSTQPAASQNLNEGRAHSPGARIFRTIENLDLTDDQRDELAEIEADLKADLTSHRATFELVGNKLAQGLESGQLTDDDAAECEKALSEAAEKGKVTVVGAINDVHDVLDADQRAQLVADLKAQREAAKKGDVEHARRGKMGDLVARLGITESQKQIISDEVKTQLDEMFPDRKARREAWEAKMEALSEAFIQDDFDAANFDLGGEAGEAIGKFTSVARTAIDISGGVLDPGQRMLLASIMRDRIASAHGR